MSNALDDKCEVNMGRRGNILSTLNKMAIEAERTERSKQREEARRQRAIQQYKKELAKKRKENAKQKGYKLSTLEDTNRMNGFLRDYVFYQFFALENEFEDLTDKQIIEITPTKKKFQAEYKANNLPKMEEKEENIGIKPSIDISNMFYLIVFILIILLIFGFRSVIKNNDYEENNNYVQKKVIIPIEEPIYEEKTEIEPWNESSNILKAPNTQKAYKYYKSPEQIKNEQKERKRQEKFEKKFQKQTEKIEKRIQKQEAKNIKKQEKAQKKQEKELNKQAKKNKKKDKE